MINILSLFSPKIRKHLINQKSTWLLANNNIKKNALGRKVVLFHAASAGEYEQLIPILKKVDREKYFLILSFFSPTIYELEKNNLLVENVVYLPFDFPWSIIKFYKLINPAYHITTRHDIWPNLINISNKLGIYNILNVKTLINNVKYFINGILYLKMINIYQNVPVVNVKSCKKFVLFLNLF